LNNTNLEEFLLQNNLNIFTCNSFENEVILSLETKFRLNPFDKLCKLLVYEIENGKLSLPIPKNLDVTNMLIPDITLIQNVRFFCELYETSFSLLKRDYDITRVFQKYLHCKRADMDEGLWQTFGIMLYLVTARGYPFVSVPMGVSMASEKKPDLLYLIMEIMKDKKIFFFAQPPAIDLYKNFCSFFRVYENGIISTRLDYDQARKFIIEHNKKII
jgi:hypothetical protein